MNVAKELLGHADIGTTAEFYTTVGEEHEAKAQWVTEAMILDAARNKKRRPLDAGAGNRPISEGWITMERGVTFCVIMGYENEPCRARTYDPLIKSQLPDSTNPETTTGYNGSENDPASNPDTSHGKDHTLDALVAAWPTLPEPVKAAIVTMVEATKGAES